MEQRQGFINNVCLQIDLADLVKLKRELLVYHKGYLNRSQASCIYNYALRNGTMDVIRIVLSFIDAEVMRMDRQLILCDMVRRGKLDVVAFLVEEKDFPLNEHVEGTVKEGIDEEEYDNIPLYEAAKIGREDIVTYLLERGANPNALHHTSDSKDLIERKCKTALHVAAAMQNIRIVQILLNRRYGTDLSIQNDEGEDFLSIAKTVSEQRLNDFLLLANDAVVVMVPSS